jgi:hypothetical protein
MPQSPAVTRRERIDGQASTMEPNAFGNGYVELTIEHKYAWRCDGCGLVWDRKWHAESCPSRNHATRWEQRYGGRVENGRHVGYTAYTRAAIRRERVEAPAATPAPSTRPAMRQSAAMPTRAGRAFGQTPARRPAIPTRPDRIAELAAEIAAITARERAARRFR